MRKVLLSTCLGAAALFAAGSAYANQELMKMSQNPKDWVMPAGNYANQRYSTLKQITADNVKNLTPKWTFSTGVLRGHEGAPLVVLVRFANDEPALLHAPHLVSETARGPQESGRQLAGPPWRARSLGQGRKDVVVGL